MVRDIHDASGERSSWVFSLKIGNREQGTGNRGRREEGFSFREL